MANTIKIKRSSTATAVPTAGQLVEGELAINVTDEILYSKDATAVFRVGLYKDVDEDITGQWDFSSNVRIRSGANLTIASDDNTVNSMAFDGGATTGSTAVLSSNGNLNLNVGGSNLQLINGKTFRIYDTGNTDYVDMSHDGTDFNAAFTNTTDWNITGITAIQAGTVDADFDAITATTYGGITEANLLDKTATEQISAIWHFKERVQVGRQTNDATYVVIGAYDGVLRGDNQDATLYLLGEQTSVVYGARVAVTGNALTFDGSTFAGATAITSIAAGTLDADFDAITATSYGGITEANLVDKTANELISGDWVFEADTGVTEIRIRKTAATSSSYISWENELDVERWRTSTSADTDDDFFIARYNDSGVFQDTPLFIDGLTGGVQIRDGVTLRIQDSTDTDYAEFSHNGTDFTGTLVGTAAYRLSGATNYVFSNTTQDTAFVSQVVGDYFPYLRLQRSGGITKTDRNWGMFVGSTGEFYISDTTGGVSPLNIGIGAPNVALVLGSGSTDSNNNLWVRDGSWLRVSDATDTDYAQFSHNGTDFNTTFVNTTEWNILDVPSVQINVQANATTSLILGETTTVRGNSQDAYLRIYGDSGTAITYGQLTQTGSNLQMTTAAGGIQINPATITQFLAGKEVRFMDSDNTDYVRFSHSGGTTPSRVFTIDAVNTDYIDFTNIVTPGGVRIRDGAQLEIYDSTDTNYLFIKHTGTDVSWTGVNTADFTVDGLTWFKLLAGGGLAIYDSTNADEVNFSHDGTYFNINAVNTDAVRLQESLWIYGAGPNQLRIYDAGGTDYAAFSHDGTDFNTTFNNTTDWNVSGISNLILSSNFYPTGLIQGTKHSSLIHNFVADLSYEGTAFYNPETFNAYAGLDLWNAGVTLTNVMQSNRTTAQTALGTGPFRCPASSWTVYFNVAVDEMIIEIDHTAEPLRYSALVGIQWSAPGWRAKRVKIEAFNGTSWSTGLDTTTNNGTTAMCTFALSAAGVQKVRFTLGDPQNTSNYYMRISKIFGYDYTGVSSRDAVKSGTYYIDRWENSGHYGNIYPAVDSTTDLGTTSLRYANVYTDAITVTNTINADYFEATGLGPTTTAGTDDAYFGGYGIIGDRATAFYVSNASGPVKLNYAGNHGSAVKLETASAGVIVTGDVSATTIGGITEANLVDKTAAETISGGWNFDRNVAGLHRIRIENTSGTGSYQTDLHVESEVGTAALYMGVNYGDAADNAFIDNRSGGTLWIRQNGGAFAGFTAAGAFQITDSSGADYALFSHDSTDFNTAFTNTTDWNITGQTGAVAIRKTIAAADWDGLKIEYAGSWAANPTYHANLLYTDGTNRVAAMGASYGPTPIGASSNGYIAFHSFYYGGSGSEAIEPVIIEREGMSVLAGKQFRIFDSSNTDYAAFSHDGTDFNTAFTNTTDWNITGITAIQAGTVDADFDAITATSYGGITEANLVDKTATETISGHWTFQPSSGENTISIRPAAAGDNSQIWFKDESGNNRWAVSRQNTTAGGDFRISRYNSSGVFQENPLLIDGATGDITLSRDLAFSAGTVQVAGIQNQNLVDKTAAETISGIWDFTGTKTTMNQLFINESASADADVAGDGQFWVKNDAPNTPWFTDDAGNDYPLGTAAYRLYANQTDTVDGLYVNGAWYSDNATAYTLTLEASTSTAFPVGGQFTIWNEGAGTLTINEGTGDTLYLMDGSSVTDTAGGCTMAQGGYATVIRKSAAIWLIMGAGLTA